MFNYLQKLRVYWAFLGCLLLPILGNAQPCDGQEGPLPDTPVPVTGVNSSNPEVHCFYFRFDSDITGWPTGITMDLFHQYEGDLGIWIEACGEILNVVQRPGAVDNCDADCAFDQDNGDCGSSEMIGTPEEPVVLNFYDSGIDPEDGMSGGGNFGLTADDGCGVSTLGTNSFVELWSGCPEGLVEAEICFSDHASLHYGFVSNLNFIFPNPYVCGCMDPDAINYNPDASVSSGDCLYECPELGLAINNNDTTLCAGGAVFALSAIAPLAEGPTFEWFGTGLGTDFLTDLEGAVTTVELPEDFVGNITYTCVVRDVYNCQEIETVNVTVLPAPAVTIAGISDLCAGDSTLLTLTGGPYLTVAWSTGATGTSLYVGPGTYDVTVSTGAVCTATDEVTVAELPTPQPQITGLDTICVGDSTLLTATSGFEHYLWSTGDTLPTITATTAQLYTLTVTDANGCSGTTAFQLNNYPFVPLTITGPDTFCSGDTLLLSATSGFQTYLWSTGDTLPTIRLTTTDTLQLTAVDSSGCTQTAAIIVTAQPLPTPEILGTAELCPGASVTLAAANSYPVYQWSTGSTDSLITTDTSGIFTLTVQDSTGCSAAAIFTVVDAVEPVPVIAGDAQFCVGDSTLLSVATGFATYQWSNGATTATTYFSTTGTASVTVTNAAGCSGTADLMLNNFPQAPILIAGPEEICAGAEALLQAPGGYTDYLWSDGTVGPTLTTQEGGVYSLTATTPNGCSATGNFTLNVRPEPTVTISGFTEICEDGSTILTATAGFETYFWSDDTTGESIIADNEQVYSVTVTDDLGCTAVASRTITLSEPEVTIEGVDRFCLGESTTLSTTEDYATYNWSTDEQTATIQTTEAGVYGLTVTNALGCTATGSLTVTIDPLPEPTIAGELEFCAGESRELTAEAGYESYAWSVDDNETPTLVIEEAGTYMLTVTDANGCVGTTSVAAITLSAPVPQIIGELDFCPGESTVLSSSVTYESYEWSSGVNTLETTINDAEIVMLTVTDENGCIGITSETTALHPVTTPEIGGNLVFCTDGSTVLTAAVGYELYEWSNGTLEPETEIFAPGPVSLTVTDENGCVTSTTTELSLFSEQPLEIISPDGFCADASATLAASDDFAAYLWSTDEVTPSITVETAGPFSLTATDANGCTVETSVELEVYSLPEPEITGLSTICEDFSTQLSTAESYVTYQWSNLTNEPTVEIATPGTVSVTVTDTNGCAADASLEVATAPGLTPSLSEVPGICPDETVVVHVMEEYATYLWSDGSSENSLSVNTPGEYAVTVTDPAGCSGVASLTVEALTAPEVAILGAEPFCAGDGITLSAQTPSGTLVWNDGSTATTLEVNVAGEYGFEFTAANGCQASVVTNVEELALPEVTIVGDEVICEGALTELTVPTGFAAYSWSTGATGSEVSISVAGPVSITVTDAAGCTGTDVAEISTVELPFAEAGSPGRLDCAVETATLGDLSTTQGDVTYWWTGPGITTDNQNELQPEVDVAGAYTLQVIDNVFGCESAVDSVTVTDVRYAPTVVVSQLNILDCTTSSVIIDGTGTATGDQYTYQWYNADEEVIPGADALELTISEPGMYTLVVVDTLTFCSAEEEVMVDADEEYPPLTVSVNDDLNCAVTTVTLTGSIDVPTTSIVHEWTSPQGAIEGNPGDLAVTTMVPGWYYFTATDTENGCTNVDSVLVAQDVEPPVAIGGVDATLFCDDENATLSGQGSSQGVNYTYQWWLNGEPVAGATGLNLTTPTPGQYLLIVTNNENGCTAEDEVALVLDPEAPQNLTVTFDPPTCAGDLDGSIQVSEVSGGISPYLYSYDGGNFTTNPNQIGLGAGEYELIVEDANGCQLTETVTLADGNELWVELGPNDTVWVGEPFDLIPSLSVLPEELASSEWNAHLNVEALCRNCFEQAELKITETTKFFLTVTDENGCTAEDEVTIFVRKRDGIFVPNVFSPNGDATNDWFYIYTDGQTVEKINRMQVFNRWGELVFQRNDFQPDVPNLGWDGIFRNEKPNPAVYVWFAEIELKTGEEIVLKGGVTMVK